MLPLRRTASRQVVQASPSVGVATHAPRASLQVCARACRCSGRGGGMRWTGLLRQAASNSSSSGGGGAAASVPPTTTPTSSTAAPLPPPPPPPAPPAEVLFHDVFELADVDLHLQLLQEAHYKHGVWLNVPPQLAPSGPTIAPPPAVPAPIYPPTQQARLSAMAPPPSMPEAARRGVTILAGHESMSMLAYPPTHGPPPFASTGTRSLWVPEQAWTARDTASVTGRAPTITTTTTTAAARSTAAAASSVKVEMQTVAVRAPVDPDARFHCSRCGRGFRREEAARQHVLERHGGEELPSPSPSSSSSSTSGGKTAQVMEGPGLGEIISYESRAVAAATPTSSAAAAAAAAPHPRTETTHGSAAEAVPVQPATSATPPTATEGTPASPTTADHTSTAAAAASAATPTASLTSGAAEAETAAAASADAATRRRLASAYAYGSTPTVTLPADDLINAVLQETWDAVALHRDDIEKPAGLDAQAAVLPHSTSQYDSCGGRFFIPSTCVVEGTADNRAELDAALAERAAPRATPEGVAPGIKRRSVMGDAAAPTTIAAAAAAASAAAAARRLTLQRRAGDGSIGDGLGSGALLTAPTAMEMTIAELSRHYPNPFGDSPNAALMEAEKEPVNPFVDLESRAARQADTAGAAVGDADGSGSAAEPATAEAPALSEAETWLAQFTRRPYACPVCMRRALPAAAAALTAAASAAATPRPGGLASGEADAFSSAYPTGPLVAMPARAAGEEVAGTPTVASEARTLTADSEALAWYTARVPRFRLLDALQDHIDDVHDAAEVVATAASCDSGAESCDSGAESCDSGAESCDSGAAEASTGLNAVTEREWRYLYGIALGPLQAARAELLAVQQAFCALHPRRGSSTAAAAHGDVDADGVDRESGATLDADAAAAADAADAAAEAPPLHLRSAANAVLVGTVRDVQEGFVGATRILQYVLAVRNPRTPPPRSEARATLCVEGQEGEGEAGAAAAGAAGEETSEELVVVRCVGDLVPVALLRQQVRLGSTMFVSGSLRMNRNTDTVSRRSHAYPYVQVAPPLGCVRVLCT